MGERRKKKIKGLIRIFDKMTGYPKISVWGPRIREKRKKPGP